MESAKNQTLWPNFSEGENPEFGKHDFVPASVPTSENTQSEPIPEPVVAPFAMEKDLFSSLLRDYGISSQIDGIVEERVKALIDSRWEAEKEKIAVFTKESCEKGFKDGYAEGSAKAQKEFEEARRAYWQEFQPRLESICSEIVSLKASLIHDHEKLWMQALRNIFKRFCVAKAPEIGNELEQWLNDAVADFADKRQVRIFLSTQEFDTFMKVPPVENKKWDVQCDPTLKAGEARYEADGGGIFFSPSQESENLETIFKRFA